MLQKVKKMSYEEKTSPFLGLGCALYHPYSRISRLRLRRHPDELHHVEGLGDNDRRLGGKSGPSPPLSLC